MKLKSIGIENVKSFKSPINIELDQEFNIIIGPNASGKSNLLDVITVVLRKYFLFTYLATDEPTGSKFRLSKSDPFTDPSIHLEKYLRSTTTSKINIQFIVTSEDIDNILICKRNRARLLAHLETSSLQGDNVTNMLRNTRWDDALFEIGDVLEYSIIDNNLNFVVNDHHMINYPVVGMTADQLKQVKFQMFLRYLNLHQLYTIFNHLFALEHLKPSFLILSPYRVAGNDQDFHGQLSQQSSAALANNLQNTTSKQTSSLVKIATTYFSEKLRAFESEAKNVGYQSLWQNDPEVIVVSKYLKRLGYSWNLILKNRNSNIYEIELEKQGHRL